METERTDGIILRTYPSGEADLVLRVLTRSLGKLSIIAKHARGSKKRYGSGLDVFDSGSLEVSAARGTLHPLRSFSPLRSWPKLREDLDKLSAASVVCECFDAVIMEGLELSAETHEILGLGLTAINEAASKREILRACHVTLASLLRVTGLLDNEQFSAPSAKNLLQLFGIIQENSDREVKSMPMLLDVVESLKNSLEDK